MTVVVGGFIILGFADGEAIRISRDDDAFYKTVGVSGEVARRLSLNTAGSLTISLMQSSISNDDLSTLTALDYATGGLAGAVPVLVRDKSGRSVFASVFGWVKKLPDSVYASDVGIREWTIDCAALLESLGGN